MELIERQFHGEKKRKYVNMNLRLTFKIKFKKK